MSRVFQIPLLVVLTGRLVSSAFAQEPFATSNQPYIDRLKATMPPESKRDAKFQAVQTSENPNPYIDEVKKTPKVARPGEIPEPPEGQSYTEFLKSRLGEEKAPGESYSEREKQRLIETKDKESADVSAIARVKEGNSELEMVRKGTIHYAAGLQMGTSVTRVVTAIPGASLRNFNDVYGTGWIPDLQLFAELQPFHSEWVGNFGLIAGGGASVFKGTGAFSRDIHLATELGGGLVPRAVDVTFRFISLPVFAGANFRLNLFRIFRPFVQATPVLIPYREIRDDNSNTRGGFSKGLIATAGVNILLDWMSKTAAWDIYTAANVKHTYMSVTYTRLTTVSSAVNFDFSGIDLGFTFEF